MEGLKCRIIRNNRIIQRRRNHYVGQDVGQAKYLSEIIQLIRENNKITKATIAKELGVSEKTIEREMKKTNKIVYIGSGYSGHWEIKE